MQFFTAGLMANSLKVLLFKILIPFWFGILKQSNKKKYKKLIHVSMSNLSHFHKIIYRVTGIRLMKNCFYCLELEKKCIILNKNWWLFNSSMVGGGGEVYCFCCAIFLIETKLVCTLNRIYICGLTWLYLLQAVRLNHRKDPVAILNEENTLLNDKMIYPLTPKIYPFAMVLRLRVLQVRRNFEKYVQSFEFIKYKLYVHNWLSIYSYLLTYP